MFARSSMTQADPSRMDDGISFVRDRIWPAVKEMDGCLGLSMIVDRDSGQVVTTTSWLDEASMHASDGRLEWLRSQCDAALGGTGPAVQEWEIVSMHRAHHSEPGTCVRAAWSTVPVQHLGQAIDFYTDELLPHVEALEGFVSASLMVNRATGRGVTSVAYASREAMEATRDEADYLRARSANDAHVEFLDVGEFELVLAHLHVPELV